MIGSDGKEDGGVRPAGEVEQAIDELLLLGATGTGTECLLELVDEHDARRGRRPLVVEPSCQLPGRTRPRTDDDGLPGLAAGEHASRQRWQQAGSDQRRLAAARGANNGEKAGLGKSGDQLGDQALATEEV